MSKRLQVLLGDQEYDEIREMARREGLTVSEWVRQMIRRERRDRPQTDRARKLTAVRAAVRHDFPTTDIEEMLAEIERGYGVR